MATPNAPLRPESNTTLPLSEIARRFGFTGLENGRDALVRGVTLNTNDVREGDLFVAVPGARKHGAEYAEAARDQGAVAILTDESGVEVARASGLPVVVGAHPRSYLGELAAWLYATAEVPRLFGVTGTNGKTSVVHMIEAILRQLGVTAGLSSTAERHAGDVSIVSGLTTPEASELHGLIARMVEANVEAAAIEISAQALSRSRVSGMRFDVAGFTNLSHDHLDDYADMDAYLAAKAPLFQPALAERGVICLDTPWGDRMRDLAGIPVTTITSDPAVDADWSVEVTAESATGSSFTLTSRDGRSLATMLPVIGRHMASNAGLAIVMLVEGGYPLETIASALERDGGIRVYIPGRIERVSGERGPTVFVDFGHSADAFEKTLAAVRTVTPGRVIMVFGADGDRDATKRPAMARAAVAGSDILIVTDHHPRFENPASIRATLVAAAREFAPDHETHEVGQPELAIREAVRLAKEGDSILWAGPGHQNYRDIEGVKTVYSARHEAREALREAGW